MWVLVLVYVFNSPAMSVVPGYYTTQEKCETAAKEFRALNEFLIWTKAACIQAPDDIAYE